MTAGTFSVLCPRRSCLRGASLLTTAHLTARPGCPCVNACTHIWSFLKALHSRAYRKEACHKEPYKGISKIQTFSFFHTTKCIQGSCLSHVHCPVRSRGWQTTPTPSSSYFIETRYFSKIKALRRVNNNTLMKQEGLLGAGRAGRKADKGKKESVFLGQEKPICQDGMIWMEGACSLNLAKKRRSSSQIQFPQDSQNPPPST